MTLTPTLGSTRALFRKLEREQYRAYHSRDPIHKADHRSNFCVTAHSLRDYFFAESGCVKEIGRQRFHKSWNSVPEINATAEIANSSKHLVLKRMPRTRRVRVGKSRFVDVYLSADGDLQTQEVEAPDYFVTLPDVSRVSLYEFLEAVTQFWRDFLSKNGIRVRRQPFSILRGRAEADG